MKIPKFINVLNETDPELARREYLTRAVLFFSFIVTLIFTLISFITYLSGNMPLDTLLIFSTILVVLFSAMMMARAGYWRPVGIFPPLIMYLPAVNANYIGGIDAPGNFLYAIMIIFVVIIYGYKKIWYAVAISLITYLALAWMISNGYIKPYRTAEVVFINRVIITSGSIVGIAFLIWILGRNYRNEINERIKTADLLEIKNKKLNSLNNELRSTIEELEATNEEVEAINNELLKTQDSLVTSNEKLQFSEQKFHQIFHSSPIPMTLNELETGRYVEINDTEIQQTGFTREEMIGKTPVELGILTKESMKLISELIREKGNLVNHETTATIKDGIKITILINAYITEINNKKHIISATIDITEKKMFEENLIKSQKLESLSLIAGGLAHDFNNILMGILGNLSLARLNISSREKSLSFILNSEDACIRAQGLTSQLLTFSKGGLPVKTLFNPAEMVRNAAEFDLAGSKVRAETDISESLWNIKADEGQIRQVINNLLLNAVQAMPSGGKMNISVSNHVFNSDNTALLSTGMPLPGKYVKLTISDTGTGISKSALAKIFDPYFTTKQKGSGLGLAVVYSIIINHSGYIDVTTNEGSGTTFNIYIPADDADSTAANKSASQALNKFHEKNSAPPLSDCKILIMDDEVSIISVLKGMLSHLGYTAEGVASGSEAVELYKKSANQGSPYSVVIMDLTIPGDIGGKEVIQILQEFDKDIRAIVSSGYSDDPIFTDHSSYGFKAILRKPFRLEELSEAIKSALAQQ